jgi:Arc/MetJ-type ribon-helix-helix transcriptional regulator
MTSKILTVHITKAQRDVFAYFRDIGMHTNISELVRQGMFLQFYLFTGISTGVDDKATLDVDVNVWFKHVPKQIAKRLWAENLEESGLEEPISISMSPVQWDFVDVIVETNKEESRSSFLRKALTDFFKKELVMTETIFRVKNGMKVKENKDELKPKKDRSKVDMRSIKWKTKQQPITGLENLNGYPDES